MYSAEFEHDSCGVGFVVHLKGNRSHQIVADGLTALENVYHRGACGCEENTGDGAGILIQLPHEFFRRECAAQSIRLPEAGHYGVGALFAPQDARARAQGLALFAAIVEEEGQHLLGWRDIPTDNSTIGATAREVEPWMLHCFIGRSKDVLTEDDFERKLYVIRKRFERAIVRWDITDAEYFYVASLSCRTLVYKGMLTARQVREYFPDLSNPRLISALTMFHSRFSTNTFPSWPKAHPYRMVSHNGEINTKRGNQNWMQAREALFASPLYGNDISKLLPIIDEHGSDTAALDNALELLALSGRTLPHAMMMLIPEAWSGHESMSAEKKAFYEYHSCLMEPWDGPASVTFTDGRNIGAVLDRNGLRPSRYYVTKDDLVIMASEVGVLPIEPERVAFKGRLEPGKMFLVDLDEGRIIDDSELKTKLAQEHPYAEWLEKNLLPLADVPEAPVPEPPARDRLLELQMAFGYSLEDLKYILSPMSRNSEEALGSMGTDTPLAVLSERPQPLYNYFQQLFAQVTNPPLDAIREELVTSVKTVIGPEGNLLDPEPESCHLISLESPFLNNAQLAKFKAMKDSQLRATVLPMLFPAKAGPAGLEHAMTALFADADAAIAAGAKVLILSDRGVDAENAPIPSLLAVAGLHNHLVREKKRTQIGLVVETGDAREVHHFALLIGYGAGAINPYMSLDSLAILRDEGFLDADIAIEELQEHYLKAIKKGVVKVMSKMGISTIQSYRGAQIFEAIGLADSLIDKYFAKTTSRIGGIGLDEVAVEALTHHQRAYPVRDGGLKELQWGGQYQWRRDGELHLFNPDTVFKLQHATRTGQRKIFSEYTRLVNDQSERMCTLRGMFEFKPDREPVPLDEVEPAEALFRRFATGAMSFGSISAEAHETLAIAMNRIGGRSNTGEGGEDRRRFTPDENGDLRRSSIKQVASARFGVTSEYLVNADELQIKMAQGAKPGEGGQLPGAKVYPWIAEVRHATAGVGLISPPPHHDIYSIEDLAQLIHDLKNANDQARISVKLVAEVGVGTVATGVAKCKSDVVLISGHDGGTGASPLTSLKHAGGPWELGLAETQQTLVENKLRDRIVVQADGQMKTGRDVVVAALLGAEEFGFATAPLVVMGCVMMRVCHLDTCPVGIATQNPVLRDQFGGRAEHVVNFFRFIAEEVRELMAQLGFRSLDEMIGRSDLLDTKRAVDHWKAQGLDLSAILYRPDMGPDVAVRRVIDQDHGLDGALDRQLLIPAAKDALESQTAVVIESEIRNVNRTVGTMLGSQVTRKYGFNGLPEDTIDLRFKGSAGQSFGAFVPPGMTLRLEGDANDYFGKGLSGGKLMVYQPREATFAEEESILIGNVALYGATSGAAFVRGVAGERFAVRNSGAVAVVEGTGDHCCEYMTGGRVVVIGRTGRNFGAGMSGGIAYVWDPQGDFATRCNQDMVLLEKLDDQEDIELVHGLLQRHVEYTGSGVAERLIADWPAIATQFVKVFPKEYRRVLEEQRRAAAATQLPAATNQVVGAHGG
ncbi:glutamate synthase subunit alpha [bacterium SCGC AG-212-C10]|nr:glutamate synthase subunit alpha [bacterium SCGC AG-212-C10]